MLLSNNNNKAMRLFLITVLITTVASMTILSEVGFADAKKSCATKKWSSCKGTKGWYTHHGNHHCYKGEKDCYLKNKSHYH